MNIGQAIKMSLQSISSNKMRSFLTMLGIIIGVAAVIIMVSLVQGTTKSITEELESMGTNMLNVNLTGRYSSVKLEMEDMQEIVDDNSELLTCVAPSVSGSPTIKVGSENGTTSLIGTNQYYNKIQNANVESGRFINEYDCTNRNKSAVIGKYIVNTYFPNNPNPLGEEIKINGQIFTVIGIFEAKTSTVSEGSTDDRIMIPYTTAMRLLKNTTINSFTFQATSAEVSAQALEILEGTLLRKLGNENAFRVTDQAEMLDTINSMTGTMTAMLGGIAGISLLVGGIGIMNIMLVSVTERTREIGIRKAIGARRRSILTQFLVESIVVSCMGGIVGILLGIIGSKVIGGIMDMEAVISIGVMLLSAGFSISIGVFFGWYPANKASKLNPIEALRFD